MSGSSSHSLSLSLLFYSSLYLLSNWLRRLTWATVASRLFGNLIGSWVSQDKGKEMHNNRARWDCSGSVMHSSAFLFYTGYLQSCLVGIVVQTILSRHLAKNLHNFYFAHISITFSCALLKYLLYMRKITFFVRVSSGFLLLCCMYLSICLKVCLKFKKTGWQHHEIQTPTHTAVHKHMLYALLFPWRKLI